MSCSGCWRAGVAGSCQAQGEVCVRGSAVLEQEEEQHQGNLGQNQSGRAQCACAEESNTHMTSHCLGTLIGELMLLIIVT